MSERATKLIYNICDPSCVDVIRLEHLGFDMDYKANMAFPNEVKVEAEDDRTSGPKTMDLPDPEDVQRSLPREAQEKFG